MAVMAAGMSCLGGKQHQPCAWAALCVTARTRPLQHVAHSSRVTKHGCFPAKPEALASPAKGAASQGSRHSCLPQSWTPQEGTDISRLFRAQAGAAALLLHLEADTSWALCPF